MTDNKTVYSRSEAFEASEDNHCNKTDNPTIGEIIEARFSRRQVLKGSLGVSVMAGMAATGGNLLFPKPVQADESTFSFDEIEAGVTQDHAVADGYSADILLRWGDPILPGAPEFDPENQTAEAQAAQFGYNNDFLGFIPLTENADRGLLVVNHEYTNEELMFSGLGRQDRDKKFADTTIDHVNIEMMAHGGTVVEIALGDKGWEVVNDSKYNRRITAETEMLISGPCAGHDRMKTSYSPDGKMVRGMFNNCAGGVTPWGTWLAAEENVNGYFWNKDARDGHPEERNLKRMGAPGQWYSWGKFHDRFDIAKEPNELNRFGWVVEIDPRDPTSTPKKRTALGRFKHEGAETIINTDGRLVVYMGDDQRFDYVYKFVSDMQVDTENPENNIDLLDSGVLSVARFNESGTVDWMPLVYGTGPLTEENDFASQADVLIETRRAADLLGATQMDRPEDVQPNKQTGSVYVLLTNNTKRKDDQITASSPRAENAFGHIIEIRPEGGDHAIASAAWEILVTCGDPTANVGASFNPETTENGWFGMPDNCAIDSAGRLWIATDGNSEKKTGRTDGVWSMETEGKLRGTSRHFYRCPVGAELCGPTFTPDDTTLFVANQHPADGSSFDEPSTRWPDFDDNMPPRPSVVAITKDDGGKIG